MHQGFLHSLFKSRKFLYLHAQGIESLRRSIDGEVVRGNEHAGGDQGHNGYKAFQQHGAVAHKKHIAFTADHLGRGARADGRVESGQRAAGYGNEDEGNDRPADDGASSPGKFGEGGHVEVRHHKKDAQSQGEDGAHLEEGGQIVARQEQQPYGQHGGGEAVDRNGDGHGFPVDIQPAEQLGMRRHPGAGKQAQSQKHDPDEGCSQHVSLAPDLHVQSHEDGDGNGRCYGIGRPQTVVHGVDHGNGQPRQCQNQNGQHGPGRYRAGGLVYFPRGDVGQTLAAVPHGTEQNHHVSARRPRVRSR